MFLFIFCLLIEEPATDHLRIEANPQLSSVVIEGLLGEIYISGHDKTYLDIELRLLPTNRTRKLERSYDNDIGIVSETTQQNRITLRGTHKDSNREYRIRLPQRASLICLLKQNKDLLTLVNLTAPIEVDASSMDLKLFDVTSSLAIKTTVGDVEMIAPIWGEDWFGMVTTGSGSIAVSLPEAAQIDIIVATLKGIIQNEVNYLIQSYDGRSNKHTHLVGNGGGAMLRLESIVGDIYLTTDR